MSGPAAGTAERLDLLRLEVAAGQPPSDLASLPARCRRAIRLATAVGAPLLDAIDAAQVAEDDHRRATRAIAVASAQTRVVAGGLVCAPVVLVPALGRLVGADLVAFYSTPLGLLVLAVGLALLASGAAMVAVLVRRVARIRNRPQVRDAQVVLRARLAAGAAGLLGWWLVGPVAAGPVALLTHHLVLAPHRHPPLPAEPDEVADLTALALLGGTSPAGALRLAAAEVPALAPRLHRLAFGLELGIGPEDLDPASDDPLARLAALLAAATKIGAPVIPAVRRLARELRADDLARVLAAAERLPAQLTFPTALCLLPATILLVGAPIVDAGLAGAGL